MDIKQIQELVKLINKTSIGEITIEENGTRITIKQKKEKTIITAPSFGQPNYAPQAAQPSQQSNPSSQKIDNKSVAEDKSNNLLTIKSPMIGTFYRQSGPGKPIFVNVGDEIAPGKVVCIIEAMKLFNEIESEIKGKIVKVLVEDASPVEYDQPLFLVEPL